MATGDYKSGYSETIRVGTVKLRESVHGDYKSCYSETIRVGTVKL